MAIRWHLAVRVLRRVGHLVGETLKQPKFQKAIRLLKKRCPCAFPVRVRTVKIKHSGDTELVKTRGDKHFLIRVAIFLPSGDHDDWLLKVERTLMMDVLVHEWAHARCWNHIHDTLSIDDEVAWHGEEWGIEYARCYRALSVDW